ncbi:carboxymuconolactone decarboxylase family protein [Myceligenerans pegani]|uniref:Alkylhydroperoxidase AhpD family core domain-containing protein n=1 Tax=Myceligenerans pegani TaxID=2776917 RepID=A0ABR9N530_9MICO|nr:alkylhydroperoxidase AhpD family core domain-containing protein [Myceligenerans sp. TRM 65318]MBE1878092.1 alkylhydroperoxidase AhpD family core domain-containing protein [Myceligenerans sp. TRM 65318]MBE3020363.1 alkylhydroperoxidase AhpD family core domain-containing protein [Myceligenerans sp. TRM 65318]
MRPGILEHGYRLRDKALFRMIATFSGQPMPDAARVTFYRPGFYGAAAKRLTHQVMRGDSPWTVGERELMAAYVSTRNANQFCIGAHTATSCQALGDPDLVSAILDDPQSAPIAPHLAATLRILGTLTARHEVDAEQVRAALDAGATPQHIRDALAVAFCFNVTNRLAEAFAFEQLTSQGYADGAKFLLRRGYR